jgi:hypothetical protein
VKAKAEYFSVNKIQNTKTYLLGLVFILLPFLFFLLLYITMPEVVLKTGLPGWLNYAMTITGITALTSAALLYIYQCKLIYPAAFPEGSREMVFISFINK